MFGFSTEEISFASYARARRSSQHQQLTLVWPMGPGKISYGLTIANLLATDRSNNTLSDGVRAAINR